MVVLTPQEVSETFQAFFVTVVGLYREHEQLAIGCTAGAMGLRIGVWIKSIIDKNIVEKSQMRHDRDQDLLSEVMKERDTANARLAQVLDVMGDWAKPNYRPLDRPDDYVSESSPAVITEEFEVIAGGGHAKRRFHLRSFPWNAIGRRAS